MTTEIDDIVRVNITRESAATRRAGFNIPLFASAHTATANRIDTYTGASILNDMLTDGFLTTDDAYEQASRALAQSPRLSTIRIGRQDAADAGDWTTTLTAIEADSLATEQPYYGFTISSRAEADILDAAAFSETRFGIFFAQSGDTAVRDDTAGNVLEDLEALNYRRTALFYHAPVTEDWLDAGAMARFLAANPDAPNGMVDLAHKTITGVTRDILTGAQRANIHGPESSREGNTYERRNGKDRILWGDMVGGMAIDETLSIDWLDARLTEDVDTYLSGNPGRIDFDQEGINGVEAAVRKRLTIGESNSIVQPGWTVTVPEFADTQATDREAHLLRTVEFSALVVVGLRRVQIEGRVTV